MYILTFIGLYQSHFQSGCTSLHSHQQCTRIAGLYLLICRRSLYTALWKLVLCNMSSQTFFSKFTITLKRHWYYSPLEEWKCTWKKWSILILKHLNEKQEFWANLLSTQFATIYVINTNNLTRNFHGMCRKAACQI